MEQRDVGKSPWRTEPPSIQKLYCCHLSKSVSLVCSTGNGEPNSPLCWIHKNICESIEYQFFNKFWNTCTSNCIESFQYNLMCRRAQTPQHGKVWIRKWTELNSFTSYPVICCRREGYDQLEQSTQGTLLERIWCCRILRWYWESNFYTSLDSGWGSSGSGALTCNSKLRI